MAMTYVDALTVAIEMMNDEAVAEKLTALREQVAKKRTSTKPTKRQVENGAIKASILDILDAEEGMTVTEIVKAIGDENLTGQRVSALLRQMGEGENGTHQVHKEMVKGKALFTLA